MIRGLTVAFAVLLVICAAGWLALRRADIPYDTLETVYASNASQFMTLADGLKVHYRDEGIEDAPALVLVHGFSASLHTWEPWVDRLDETYRVVSLDLPGHGLTRTPDLDELAPRYFADRVAEVTNRLDIETFTLVGSSMGGNTAWQFALKYPEKLEGLVLVAASGWPREDGDDRPFVFRLLENSFARTLMRDLDMTSFMSSGLQDSFTDISLVTDVMVERYVLLSRAPGHRDAILTLATARDDREVATPETLSAIRVPTLILQGEDDRLVPAPNAAKFQAAIPMAELVRYENVGHLPQEEIPDASAADLKRFLNTRVHSVDAANREDVPVPADSAP